MLAHVAREGGSGFVVVVAAVCVKAQLAVMVTNELDHARRVGGVVTHVSCGVALIPASIEPIDGSCAKWSVAILA